MDIEQRKNPYNLSPDQLLNMEEWVKALRSGKYGQTYTKLKEFGKNNFCCLGVAIEVLKGLGKVKGKWAGELFKNPLGKHIAGGFLNVQMADLFGTQSNPFIIMDEVCGALISASEANDQYNFTFHQIADCLEWEYLS